LRYRISYEEGMFEGGYGIPEPELVIRDESGRELPWSPRGSGGSDTETDGELEILDLPETGRSRWCAWYHWCSTRRPGKRWR
jgi:hypothetical protein